MEVPCSLACVWCMILSHVFKHSESAHFRGSKHLRQAGSKGERKMKGLESPITMVFWLKKGMRMAVKHLRKDFRGHLRARVGPSIDNQELSRPLTRTAGSGKSEVLSIISRRKRPPWTDKRPRWTGRLLRKRPAVPHHRSITPDMLSHTPLKQVMTQPLQPIFTPQARRSCQRQLRVIHHTHSLQPLLIPQARCGWRR